MRRTLIFLVFIFSCPLVFGQKTFNKTCDGCAVPFFLESPFSPYSSNKLYQGQNEFRVVSGDIPVDSLMFSIVGNAVVEKSSSVDWILIKPTLAYEDWSPVADSLSYQLAVELTISCPSRGLSRVQSFWISPIPDPEPLLGAQYGSQTIGNGVFKAQAGIAAFPGPIYSATGLCVNCKVESFLMIRIARDGQSTTIENKGAKFEEEAMKYIDLAMPGDVYVFRKIWSRCPGQKQAHELENLIFEIK